MKIHFEKVTNSNRKAVENLQVFVEQQIFIESTAENLKESNQFPEWESAGIYDGNKLVGYATYGRWRDGRARLDRFLIDQRFQGQGYGKAACRLLILMLIEKYQTSKLYLSVYDTNSLAIRLYQQLDFVFNGELDTNGERVTEWIHQNKQIEQVRQKPQRILFHLFLLIGSICLPSVSKMINLVQSVLKKELLESKDENRIFP